MGGHRSGLDRLKQELLRRGPGVHEVFTRFPRLLGDVAFTLPFLGGLQESWNAAAADAGSTLRWVAVGHAVGASLFSEAAPSFIAETVAEKGGVGKPDPWGLARRWRQEPPLAVINLSQSVRITLGAWMAGVPMRAGVSDNHLSFLYHHPFKYRDLPVHVSERFAPLLEALTGTRALHWLPLTPANLGGRGGKGKLLGAGWSGRPYVTFGFGTRGFGKRWFPELETWPRLAQLFLDEGIDVVWLGGADERELGSALASRVRGSFDLIGQTTIPEAVALQHGAWGNVAVDTGLLHTAAATGRPTVALFGRSPEHLIFPTGPWVMGLRGPSVDAHPGQFEGIEAHGSSAHRIPAERVFRTLLSLAAEAGDVLRTPEHVRYVS